MITAILCTISILISIFFFKNILIWDVETDIDKWKLNIAIDHKKEAIERIKRLIPSFIFLVAPLFSFEWIFLLKLLIPIGIIFSVWWELFDGLYNRGRGFKWRFNGSVDEDDSILDKFLYNIGDTWEAILKYGLITIFSTLYILCVLKVIL